AHTAYYPRSGNATTTPQPGFADWIAAFPNPVDFYLLLTTDSIQPVNNENFGNVSDPFIDQQVKKLEPTPTQNLSSVASQWQALDEDTAKKAYVTVYGAEQGPKVMSNRIDFAAAVMPPSCLNSWRTQPRKPD